MILKKPYAFLIKHFRLIHIILSILTIYIAYASYQIADFFRTYVANGYTASITDAMASNYISSLIYISVAIVIIILIAIVVLLKTKNKPDKIYIFGVIYYLILLVMIIISATLLNGLSVVLWGTADARTYRDFAQIIYYPQYIFVVVLVIRAFGFNVKQFNFQTDIKELEITDTDSEEVELNINFETYKAKRTIKRFFREFTYYFKENKLVIYVIGIILILMFGYMIYNNYEKVNYTYKENQSFKYSNYTIKVIDSMLTNVDLSGNRIYEDKAYIVIKLNIVNNSINDEKIDSQNLKLYMNNDYVYPTLDLGNYFLDYGDPYMDDVIPAKGSATYIIPYMVDIKDINKNFSISIYTGTSAKVNNFLAKTITIKLNPTKIWDTDVVRTANLGDIVSFSSSNLKDSTFSITNILFTNRYQYKYESCYKKECRNYNDIVVADTNSQKNQTLMVMDYDLLLNSTSDSYININGIAPFARNFLSVEYIINEQITTCDVSYVTPLSLKDKLVLQTNKDVENASSVNLVITIRNRIYKIKLK